MGRRLLIFQNNFSQVLMELAVFIITVYRPRFMSQLFVLVSH